jgi:hypothetical protein
MYLFLTPSLNLPNCSANIIFIVTESCSVESFHIKPKLDSTILLSPISAKLGYTLPHTTNVFMQNVRHVFQIGIATSKSKITVKFDFVLALILHNMHSSTWAHFKTHQISFLVYPED